MKTKTNSTDSLHWCGCCHRYLPIGSFYFTNRRTGVLDHYCKECRKAASSRNYEWRTIERMQREQRQYPVLTDITDPELRLQMLLRALEVVRQRVARRQRKLREAEARQEGIDQ